MPDVMDSVQERELEVLSQQIAASRINSGVSAFFCEDCDAPISEARRTALAGVVRCVTCQEITEQHQKHFRKSK